MHCVYDTLNLAEPANRVHSNLQMYTAGNLKFSNPHFLLLDLEPYSAANTAQYCNPQSHVVLTVVWSITLMRSLPCHATPWIIRVTHVYLV